MANKYLGINDTYERIGVSYTLTADGNTMTTTMVASFWGFAFPDDVDTTARVYFSNEPREWKVSDPWMNTEEIVGETVGNYTYYYRDVEFTFANDSITGGGTGTLYFVYDGDLSPFYDAETQSKEISGHKGFSWTFDLPVVSSGIRLIYGSTFFDTGNPYITYSAPITNGLTVKSCQVGIFLKDTDEELVAYQDVSPDDTSYTFALTDEERTKVRQAVSDSSSATIVYRAKTVVGDATYYSEYEQTLTIVAANPILNPTIVDTNVETLYLTGDENKLIRYYSDVEYAINATAQNEATIVSQSISCGGTVRTTATGTIGNVESGTFVVTATDSRGNIGTVTVEKTFIPYVKITCNLYAEPPTGEGDITIRAHGNYYKGSFGAYSNTLVVLYRYKEKNGSWGDWTTITNVTTDSNNNTYEGTISLDGFDYLKTYVFQARAYDMLATVDTPEKVVTTIPVFDWSKTDFNFNAPITWTDYDTSNTYSISGAMKALTNSYALATTYTAGSNYSSASGSNAVLLGGNLRCYIHAVRKTASGAGNVANEVIGTLTIKHDGKIKAMYRTGFVNGATGGLAAFQTYNETNDGTYLTMDVQLVAADVATTEFSTFFTVPVVINTTAY